MLLVSGVSEVFFDVLMADVNFAIATSIISTTATKCGFEPSSIGVLVASDWIFSICWTCLTTMLLVSGVSEVFFDVLMADVNFAIATSIISTTVMMVSWMLQQFQMETYGSKRGGDILLHELPLDVVAMSEGCRLRRLVAAVEQHAPSERRRRVARVVCTRIEPQVQSVVHAAECDAIRLLRGSDDSSEQRSSREELLLLLHPRFLLFVSHIAVELFKIVSPSRDAEQGFFSSCVTYFLENGSVTGWELSARKDLGPKRTWWAVTLLGSVGLTTWYWVDRTFYFFSNPLQTSITVVESRGLVLPDVTVCTRHRFNMTKVRNLWRRISGHDDVPPTADLDLLDYVNPDQFWELVAYTLEELVVECKYMQYLDCLHPKFWTPVMTAHGKCFTLMGLQSWISGEKFGVKLRLNATPDLIANRVGYMSIRSGWVVSVHPKGVPPDILLLEKSVVNVPSLFTESNGSRYDIALHSRISIKVSHFENIPVGQTPCVSDPEYNYENCKVHCLNQFVVNNCGCRMSFMRNVEAPPCLTREEVVNVTNYLDGVYFNGTWNMSMCDCPQQCVETVYKVSVDSTKMKPVPEGKGNESFKFFHCKRICERKMECLIGIAFNDFAVLASEMNAAQSILLMKAEEDKMFKLDDRLLMGVCGEAGDSKHFAEYISKNLTLYRMRNGYSLDAQRAAHFTRKNLADYLRRSPYNVNMLIAGYDEKTGGEIYFLDYLATLSKLPFVAHGYGGLFSLSVMDRYYKPDATKEEAVEIIKKCIKEVHQRLIINMPNFQLRCVDKDGVTDLGVINAADLKVPNIGEASSASASWCVKISMADAAALEEIRKTFLDLCESSPEGLSNSVLDANMKGIDPKLRVTAINKLLGSGLVEVLKKGKELFYRKKAPVSAQEAGTLRSIQDKEERLIYKLIANAGNKGVWLRDLRNASNLALTQVTKLLKSLEGKKLVKAIKSVSAAKKKVYMLYDLEPDQSLTGGAWYSDQEFESEYVDVLMDQVAKFLARKAQNSKERNSANGPLAVLNGSYVTVAQVHNYIGDLGISKVRLTLQEVSSILEALILDRVAEREMALIDDLDEIREENGEKEADEKEISERKYRAATELLPSPGLVRTPCGMCPVFDRCSYVGSVTPLKCHYFKDWLNE
ncbi:unnamed protein product [Notodromas monacha]|uniref:Proteasome subunit beta type-2 n=1 Tax=Notodromas monacha TaxID=399045 RepID=A0A7R9BX71_9CRUS|nr:unnamed protein product [Notodromas monacha]CAG0921883.1 unnamed protein product [Notodromas monacha]